MPPNPIERIFDSPDLVNKIQRILPSLFYMAEIESTRGGKVGMEVGCLRERVIAALLVHVFGSQNVEAEIPTTSSELDLRLFGRPLSVKTIKGSSGVKAVWTVRDRGVGHFMETYTPKSDMILARVNWGGRGCLTYVPLEAQVEVLEAMGRERYLSIPGGNNPRGVEYSKAAMEGLERHASTRSIPIAWRVPKMQYDPIKRWLTYWETGDLTKGL